MAIDPRIPLGTQPLDTSSPLLQLSEQKRQDEETAYQRGRDTKQDTVAAEDRTYNRERQAKQDAMAEKNQQREWRSLDMQDKLRAQQLASAEFANQDAREQGRIKSTIIAAAELNGYLKSGDMDGARNMLQQRKATLQKRMAHGENIDTTETDYALDMLDKDPMQLRKVTESMIDSGQLIGVLQIPKNSTADTTFKGEGDLRKELTGITKDYRDVTDAYARIEASAKDPSAAGDLSLIFQYMKILDPTSTVREGEFANAQNATGVPGAVLNMYNKVISGERLNDDQRLDFTGRAKKLFDAQTNTYNERVKQYRGLAEGYNLNPDNVAKTVTTAQDPAAAGDKTGLKTQGAPIKFLGFEGQ